MEITFPFWFKIFLALAALSVIAGFLKYALMEKHIKAIQELPEPRKTKAIKSYKTAMTIHKIFLWSSPLQLIAVPYIFYIYIPEHLFHILVMLAFVYIGVIEDHFFRRHVLNKIQP